MDYVMSDLVARTGLASRTLRHYTELGLLPKPEGHGPGAKYSEEHMLRAVAIARMRAGGMGVDAVRAHVEGWTLARFRRYVRDTDPRPGATPPEAASPEGECEPVSREARARRTAIEPDGEADDEALAYGLTYRLLPLLPGLALMVDADAPPVVRRVAAEILRHYGPTRRRRDP